MFTRHFPSLLFLVFAVGFGCSPIEDGRESVINDSDSVLSQQYLPMTSNNTNFKSFDVNSGIVIAEITDKTIVPEVGKVFVWTSDYDSSIRRIKTVTVTESGEYELNTEDGCMTDIFSSASFVLASNKASNITKSSGKKVFYPEGIRIDGYPTKGIDNSIGVLSTSLYLSEPLWSASDASSVISFDGSFESSLDLVLDFNFDSKIDAIKKALKSEIELKAGIIGSIAIDCGVKMSCSVSSDIEQTELLIKENVIPAVTMKFFPYGIPVFVHCSTDLMGDNNLSVSGEFEASLGASYSLSTSAGLQYSQQSGAIELFNDTQKEIKPLKPRLSGSVEIENKTSLYPRFKVYLYNVLGPIIDFKPYVKQTASGNANIELGIESVYDLSLVYSAYLGMDMGAAIHLPTLNGQGKDVAKGEMQLFEHEIYRAPKEIKVKNKPTSARPVVTFAINDYYPYTDETIETALPIPVSVRTDSEETTLIAKNGEISVPVPTTDEIYKIVASVITPTGEISSAEYEKDIRDVLVAFYESTDGDHWYNNDNWCSELPIEEWFGIEVSQGKVVIDLSDNNLTGYVDIADCKELYSIKLSGNNISSFKISNVPVIDELKLDNNPLEELIIKGTHFPFILSKRSSQSYNFDDTPLRYFEAYYTHESPSDEDYWSIANWHADSIELVGDINGLRISGDNTQSNIKIKGNNFRFLNIYNKGIYWDNLKNIDVSNCTALEVMKSKGLSINTINGLVTLNATGCVSLLSVDIDTSIENVILSGCSSLPSAFFPDLNSIELTGCVSLETLNLSGFKGQSFDLSSCVNLKELDCRGSAIRVLNLDNCRSIQEVNCYDCKELLQQIPLWFDTFVFRHDERFEYEWHYNTIAEQWYFTYKDHGYGWWYAGEPGKGDHRR